MIQFLQSLRYFNTVNGTLQIIELLAKAADLTQPVTLTAPPTARLQRLMLCTELALCMFSRTLNSNKFLLYFTTHVLPLIQVPSVPPPDTQTKQIDLCHLYAQLSTNVADLDSADDVMTAIVQKLLEFLPTPVDVDVEQSSAAAAATAQHPTRLNFAYVECLLYALHSIGKRHESFFKESSATPEREALVRSLKRQLQYFTICKQAYVKKMEVAKSKKLKAGAGRVAEERKKFETVERMIANITQLIRDLFHTPPSYTASIKLSWKSKDGIASGVGVASAPAGGQKRARITFADSSSSNGAAATTAAVEAQTKWRKDDVGLGGERKTLFAKLGPIRYTLSTQGEDSVGVASDAAAVYAVFSDLGNPSHAYNLKDALFCYQPFIYCSVYLLIDQMPVRRHSPLGLIH